MNRTLRLLLLSALALGLLALLAPLAFASSNAQSNVPVVIIDRPPSSSEYDEGQTVTVESTSAAAVGIVQVDLYVDGKLADSDITPNNQPQTQFKVLQTWQAVGAGQHTVTVRATDSENQKGEASIFVIVRGSTPTATPTTTPPSFSTPTPGPQSCTLSARFVRDVTIPDNTVVAPGSVFTKIWEIQNNGSCTWEAGYTAVFTGGEQMAGASPTPIQPTLPGQTVNISINFIAPGTPGAHRSNWTLQAPNGTRFSSGFYVLIQVPGPPTPIPPPPTPRPPPPPSGCQGAPQIQYFSANPTQILQGQSTFVSWGLVSNADYVALVTPNGSSGIATPGGQPLRPNQTSTYTLAAYCKGVQVQQQVTVQVMGTPPTPPPSQPNRINSVQTERVSNTQIKVTVNYFWNGESAPANINAIGLQSGRPHTNQPSVGIIAGFTKFVILNLTGGLKINSVTACMSGRGGVDLACRTAPVR